MKKVFLFLSLFICFFACSCSQNTESSTDSYKLSIVAPSGAPAVALAYTAEDADITFGLAADALKTAFTGKTSDMIVAPINMGASMYKANGAYKLASVLTWGNLYLASQKPITEDTLSTRSLILFGENTINDVIVTYCIGDTSFKDITYLSDTNATRDALLNDSENIYLVAEPALSLASKSLKAKGVTLYSLSIQDSYSGRTGRNSYPQAGLFVNTETITNHKTVVDEFLKKVEESCKSVNEDASQASKKCVELQIFANAEVLEAAIPNCNIRYLKASDSQADIELVANLNLKLFGGATPSNAFYYA